MNTCAPRSQKSWVSQFDRLLCRKRPEFFALCVGERKVLQRGEQGQEQEFKVAKAENGGGEIGGNDGRRGCRRTVDCRRQKSGKDGLSLDATGVRVLEGYGRRQRPGNGRTQCRANKLEFADERRGDKGSCLRKLPRLLG